MIDIAKLLDFARVFIPGAMAGCDTVGAASDD
jgi:hypothetical protein